MFGFDYGLKSLDVGAERKNDKIIMPGILRGLASFTVGLGLTSSDFCGISKCLSREILLANTLICRTSLSVSTHVIQLELSFANNLHLFLFFSNSTIYKSLQLKKSNLFSRGLATL